jgi:hypothetical protein
MDIALMQYSEKLATRSVIVAVKTLAPKTKKNKKRWDGIPKK